MVLKRFRVILFLVLCSFALGQIDSQDASLDESSGEAGNPHNEFECPACHQGLYAKKENIDKDLCYKCHKMEKYRNKKFRHSLDIGCLSCHKNHQPKSEPLLKNDPIDVCLDCHENIGSERMHPLRVRDPNTGGELTCTSSCHDVHGTDFKFLCRREPGRTLCISCHQDLK